jgi:hypothetical protein
LVTGAKSWAAHGGEAMALESYPAEVWRRFIFDQVHVAKKIGAPPNVVSEEGRSHFSTWSIGNSLGEKK